MIGKSSNITRSNYLQRWGTRHLCQVFLKAVFVKRALPWQSYFCVPHQAEHGASVVQ